jgi:hypothetical protein
VNRDQIITTIYKDAELRRLARQGCTSKTQFEDLWHYVMEIVCAMPPENIEGMKPERLKWYVYVIIRNTFWNKRSAFHKAFMTHEVRIDDYTDFYNELAELVPDESEESLFKMDAFTLNDFFTFCEMRKVDGDKRIQLAATATMAYMTYTPEKKRSYRDFMKVSGVHYASMCVYVKTMVKEFINQTKQTNEGE